MGRRIFSYDYEMFVKDPFRFGSGMRNLRRRFANMLETEKSDILCNMDLAYHIWRVTKNALTIPKIRHIYSKQIDAFNRRFGIRDGEPNPVYCDEKGVRHTVANLDRQTIDLLTLCCTPTREFPNVWEFPKGICRSGETEQECALREFAEEVGGDPRKVRFIESSCERLAEKFYGTDRVLYNYVYFPAIYNDTVLNSARGDGELVKVGVYPIYQVAAMVGQHSTRYKCIQYFLKKYSDMVAAYLL